MQRRHVQNRKTSVQQLVCPMWRSWLDHRHTQVISQASTRPAADYSERRGGLSGPAVSQPGFMFV